MFSCPYKYARTELPHCIIDEQPRRSLISARRFLENHSVMVLAITIRAYRAKSLTPATDFFLLYA